LQNTLNAIFDFKAAYAKKVKLFIISEKQTGILTFMPLFHKCHTMQKKPLKVRLQRMFAS